MNKLLLLLVLALPSMAHAQWRVGVTAGADCNHYSIDTHYQDDVTYKDRWGMTVGLAGQYDVTEWLGVRAELNWTQKNYRRKRNIIEAQNYKVVNNYLQLPVMASFSFGGEKFRGFCNLGVYGGYWMNGRIEGTDLNKMTVKVFDFSQKYEFNSDRDRRFEFGYVGGVGVEYSFCNRWAAQIEARYYYAATSNYKSETVKDPRYNNTLALQAGVFYKF